MSACRDLPWLSFQGQHYTLISDLIPHGGKPDDLHMTESAYSEIKHDHSGSQAATAEKTKSSEDHSPQPKEGWYLALCYYIYIPKSVVLTSLQIMSEF